jgi:hypothetical protein
MMAVVVGGRQNVYIILRPHLPRKNGVLCITGQTADLK